MGLEYRSMILFECNSSVEAIRKKRTLWQAQTGPGRGRYYEGYLPHPYSMMRENFDQFMSSGSFADCHSFLFF